MHLLPTPMPSALDMLAAHHPDAVDRNASREHPSVEQLIAGQVGSVFEVEGYDVGRPPWRVLLTVTLPNILPGLGAAALLVFMQLMKELTATLVLAPTGVDTLSIELWRQSSQMRYGAAAPFAALLVVVSGVPAYWATVQLQKRSRRR